MLLRHHFKQLLVGAACLIAALPVLAQEYPSKPIRIIVANAPGGAPDLVIRIIGPELSKILGQSIVIENKTGAGSIIGYEYVAKQVPADGYTLAVTTVPTLASLPIAVKNLRFDPLKELPPIIGMVDSRLALFTSGTSRWNSLNDMIAEAKANPGKLNYGSSVFLTQVLTEAIIRDRGVKVTSVPYKDSGSLINGVIGEQVQFGMLSLPSVTALGSKVKLLVITGKTRLPEIPGTATLAELGMPQFQSTGFALNAPVGVPQPIIAKLHAAMVQVLRQQEVVARFSKLGFEVADLSVDAGSKRLAAEAEMFADIGKKAGIQPQ